MEQIANPSVAIVSHYDNFNFGDFHLEFPARTESDTATVYIFYDVNASLSHEGTDLSCEVFGSYFFFSSPPLPEHMSVTLSGDLELIDENDIVITSLQVRMRFGPRNTTIPHKFDNFYSKSGFLDIAKVKKCRLFGQDGFRP